jgi:hypothetical protein
MTARFVPVRLAVANRLAAFATFAAMQLSACSSSHPRDVNYGTDVGLYYVPGSNDTLATDAANPNSGAVDSADAATLDSNPADSAVADGGVSEDASVDEAP